MSESPLRPAYPLVKAPFIRLRERRERNPREADWKAIMVLQMDWEEETRKEKSSLTACEICIHEHAWVNAAWARLLLSTNFYPQNEFKRLDIRHSAFNLARTFAIWTTLKLNRKIKQFGNRKPNWISV